MPSSKGEGPGALSEAMLRRLVGDSSLAVQVYRLEDPKDLGSFRFLYANTACAAQAGVAYETLLADLGKILHECAPALLQTEAPARYRQVLESGESTRLDLTYGDTRYPTSVFRVYAWALDDRTVALAFTNVTNEVETQRQLDETLRALRVAYEELERSRARQVQVEKLAALGQLSAGLAHEINNPLLVIKGYATQLRELLQQEELSEGPAIARSLERIARASTRIESIANRMSWYSRHADRAVGRIKVNAVLRGVEELLLPQLLDRGIELVVSTCELDPEITGDEVRLEQLFVNLVLNSRDAITTAGRASGSIAIAAQCTEERVLVRVTDNGCGITDEVAKKMFDPFYSTKPPGAGVGLGLSIVHEIAQELGGQIDCESTPGQGATFILRIPRRT